MENLKTEHTKMGNDISSRGWNKTYETFEEIPKSVGSIDCHAWITHNGKVIDYPIEKLMKKSAYATNKVVRKPFPQMLQVQLLPHVVNIWRNNIKLMKQTTPKSFWKTQKRYWDNEAGNCFMKVIQYWKKHHNDGAKIVFGSLGFVQTDGNIFYEYG